MKVEGVKLDTNSKSVEVEVDVRKDFVREQGRQAANGARTYGVETLIFCRMPGCRRCKAETHEYRKRNLLP